MYASVTLQPDLIQYYIIPLFKRQRIETKLFKGADQYGAAEPVHSATTSAVRGAHNSAAMPFQCTGSKPNMI